MSKREDRLHNDSKLKPPGIVYILAFLIGVILFLLFGESWTGIKPDPAWIALLMGLSISAVVFWVWSETHQ